MPAEIRIYFEGHRLLKAGFDQFFRELREHAREKRCRFRLISSRSGEQARRDFDIAIKVHRNAWSILLRDSEGPLRRNSREPHSDQIFWMVEMMEAWLHADSAKLAEFYGKCFQQKALKANPKVEQIPKTDLEKGLARATRNCKKGGYFDNKTSHGPKLLACIRPTLVRRSAPNCDRLFNAVIAVLK